jgi:hypothetical protein
MTIAVRAVLKSISPQGRKIASIYARYPLFIHNELLTHRAFSRNSASSRAIPVERMIDSVQRDPVIPTYWGKNQPGMKAEEECSAQVELWHSEFGASDCFVDREEAWLHAMHNAVGQARAFEAAGYHKQIVNRLLAPFAHIETLITSTEWENFDALRCHPDAEPHMQDLASAIRAVILPDNWTPLPEFGWHIPFLDERDADLSLSDKLKVSVARCAMVSYFDPDGKPTPREKEFERYNKLLSSRPLHASPFEHQAQVDDLGLAERHWRNFTYYRQHRSVIESVPEHERG